MIKCGSRARLGAVLASLLAVDVSRLPAAYGQTAQPDTGQSDGFQSVVNQITQLAVQLGALSCAATIKQVTSFLGVTSETKASLRSSKYPPDKKQIIVNWLSALAFPGTGTI